MSAHFFLDRCKVPLDAILLDAIALGQAVPMARRVPIDQPVLVRRAYARYLIPLLPTVRHLKATRRHSSPTHGLATWPSTARPSGRRGACAGQKAPIRSAPRPSLVGRRRVDLDDLDLDVAQVARAGHALALALGRVVGLGRARGPADEAAVPVVRDEAVSLVPLRGAVRVDVVDVREVGLEPAQAQPGKISKQIMW